MHQVYKDGQIHHDAYERGIPTVELDRWTSAGGWRRQERPERRSIFCRIGEILKRTRFKADWLKSRLHETAYLEPRLTIHYENKRAGEAEKMTYAEPDGIVAYVTASSNSSEDAGP
ncbi:MAG: hypothetical protein ACLTR6_16270 [Clostridium fessum]